MNRGVLVGLGVAVVLAALIAFVAGGGETGAGDPDTPYGEVTVSGTELPRYAAQAPDLAVGAPMPVVEGTDLFGETLTLGPTGEPQAIVFLAHWCPHCQREVPDVQSWLDETGGVEGVGIVGVATGIDPGQPNYSPRDWLSRERWEPATLWDDEASSALAAFGGNSFPFWVFVDGDGTIMGRLAGGMGSAELERILTTLSG